MIGRTLDDFRVVALLGRGGMGEVWKAEQISLGGRPVALKLLRADRADLARAVQRLQRESVLLASVKHPGIAQVYRQGEAEGLHYIAMELVEGETLADRLRAGALDPAEARRIVLAVTQALQHAHGRGVLHRDITPGNIMLEAGGRVVLLDFGLARAMEGGHTTSTGVVVGTPQFIAPEVLRGYEPDARSDLYSLGVVLYVALTGATPFAGLRPEQVIHAVLHEAPRAPSQRRPGLPPDWDPFTLRAVAREPGLRFQGAEEFARALAALSTPSDEFASTQRMHAPATSASPRRVAVMPFADLSGTPEGAAFADGFSDAIGIALARLPALQVVPAISTRELVREGLRRVAREFDVEHVLSGTLQHTGASLRVAFSLIDARSAVPVKADVIEGDLAGLGGVEARLVRAVQEGLHLAVPAPRDTGAGSRPVLHEKLMQARGYLQRFDNEGAVDGALRLLETLTQSADARAAEWAEFARACRHKHHLTQERTWIERALHAARLALQLDPDDVDAIEEMGQIHAELGRHEEAEHELRDAIEREPHHLRARSGLVDLLRRQGRLAEAETAARSAIAIRPDSWNAYNALGAVLFARGQYEDAIEQWRHVARLTPDNPRAYQNMGSTFLRLGRFDEAEREFQASLERQRTAGAFAGVGTVLYRRGDFAGAAEAFDRGVSLNDSSALLWGNLGMALRRVADASARAGAALDRAIGLARANLDLNPRDAAMMAHMAGWLAARGDLDDAAHWIERSLALAPDDANGLAQAVTVHELRGERAQALGALERALALHGGLSEFEGDDDLVRLRATKEYEALRERFTTADGLGAAPAEPSPRPEVQT